MRKHPIQLGGSGVMFPQKSFGTYPVEAMRLLLRPHLGQCDASRRPDDRVEYLSAHCVVYSTGLAFRSATSFADEACETNRSLV